MKTNLTKIGGETLSPRVILSCLLGAAIAFCFTGQASHGERQAKPMGTHTVILPSIRPDANSDCNAEAAAYATALNDLDIAEEAADDAWQAWYDCDQGAGQGQKQVNLTKLRAETHSVLKR